MSLYADDLLLFIKNPTASLSPAPSLFSQFSQFSVYQLNLHKSKLFPVNEEAILSEYTNLPLKIVKNHFAYLVITVTRKYRGLFFFFLTSLLC